jgi:hypothetical protein
MAELLFAPAVTGLLHLPDVLDRLSKSFRRQSSGPRLLFTTEDDGAAALHHGG